MYLRFCKGTNYNLKNKHQLLTKTLNTMKNFTKLFVAVVTGIFAFSCVTDTTDDLGVNIETGKGKGNTQVTLSLEQSRTQLGAKAEGLYPVYWSEGDAIAINGAISAPLAAEYAGAPSADFHFGEQELVYPYCVVYPAPEAVAIEDETTEEPSTEPVLPENTFPVTFANVQPYTVGTFAPKSAPMYAYAVEPAEGEAVAPIQMNHLTGVLRLAVKGDVTLASMTVAAEGKIAGTFLVDCKSGTLTAHEEALNNITVVLPEGGLKLSATEATPIYVAVPAGEHGIYTITLVSDALADNTMVVRFNSDFHKVEPGVVKEFGEITFTPNAASGQEGELVIVNAAQMKRLAQLSEVGQLSGVTKVTIGATIDMSGVADWHGIELLPSHIVFDGGSDKGYEISGLKAPLFGATAATIKNVKLTNVAIVETEETMVGAIARRFDGKMTNCEASGALEMNNTTFDTTASLKMYDVITIGGLVGLATNATIEDCKSYVNVTIKSVAAEAEEPYIGVGGAIGAAHTLTSLTNVDNYGNVVLDVREEKIYSHTGGVIGQMAPISTDEANAPDVKVMTKCDNYGTITTTAETTGLSSARIGGITGYMTRGITNFSDNHNYGAITCNDASGNRNVGGIVGGHNWSPIDNCTNNAPITNIGAAGATRLGGIIAGDVLFAITNCTNNVEGVIKNSGELSGSNNVYAGGIAASDLTITNDDYAAYDLKAENCYVSNCHNKAEIIHDGTCKSIFLAGIVARTTSATISNCTNTAAVKHLGISTGNTYVAGICALQCNSVDKCTNSAAITIGGDELVPTGGYLYLSGLVGDVKGSITNCENSGAVTLAGDANSTTKFSTINVAGITRGSYGKIANTKNSGSITVKDIATGTLKVAGIVNMLYTTTDDYSKGEWKDVENSGNITFDNVTGWTGNTNCYIGGLASYILQSGSDLTAENRVELRNWTNKGNITATNFAPGLASGKDGRTILGGCFGHYTISWFDLNNCDNEGNLNIEIAAASHTFIGGIAGFLNQSGTIADTTCSMLNCNNSGAVTVNTVARTDTAATAFAGEGLVVGGLFGEWYVQQATLQPITLTNCNNSGAVTLKGTLMAPKTSRHVVGGVSADHYSNGTFINCHNSGAVGVVGTAATTGGMVDANNLQVGGVTAYYHPYRQNADQIGEWIGCTNTGNISIKNIKIASYVMIGGVLGYNQNRGAGSTNFKDCGNSGELLMENVSATANSFEMAGIVAYNHDSEAAFTGEVVNTGNIIAKNVTTMASKTYIGGILGYTVMPIANAKSYCDIEALGLKGKVGMIMGIPYASATKATNCSVGGSIAFDSKEDNDPSGDLILVPNFQSIAGNWYEHIYTDETTQAIAEGDGCSLLAEKPALPTYTPAE